MTANKLGTEAAQQLIAIWAKTVDTQMHFNEMQVKSRQLGLTFVTAALGIGIVLLSNGDDFSFRVRVASHDLTIHISVLLVAAALLALQAVKLLDLNVYHRMLRGAVTFGEDFEKNCLVPMLGLEKGMTSSISHFSRLSDASVAVSESGIYNYRGSCKVTAFDKINSFYHWTQLFLAIAAITLLIVTNNSSFVSSSAVEDKSSTAAAMPAPQAEAQSIEPKPEAVPDVKQEK